MKDSARLSWSHTALLSLLALACGGEKKPPPLDPPQASLSVTKASTVGQKLTVQVSASGCDQIHSLSILDGETFIKTVPYTGGSYVPVDIGYNEIKYTKGIAAKLSLKARVVCTDGRQNDSQPQAATFFPAAEVLAAPPGGGLVVPEHFVADGAFPEVSFLGCGNDPNEGGVPKLYRIDRNGNLVKSVRMPFICTHGTVITPKNPVSGKRWVWTQDAGAIAVDANLTISARVTLPLDLLAVGLDGDAIIYDAGTSGESKQVLRVSHLNGANKWPRVYFPVGFLITSPVVRGDEVVFASITTTDAPANKANIVATTVDYGNQIPAAGGLQVGDAFILKQVANPGPTVTEAPPSVFSPTGNLLYMAFTGLGGVTTLHACVTNGPGCEFDQGTQLWQDPPAFASPIGAMVPYATGSRMAVIASRQVWFLDTKTGAVLNKGGLQGPLTPEGALVVLQVQSGGSSSPQSFYILNGAIPPPGVASQPLEIVATDDPANGELYRYQINSGTIAAAMDDGGTLWLRIGSDLVRPLTPGEYRQVRPVTP